MCGAWGNPSRSDLLLIRKAIKEGWPVPRERQRLLMDAVMALIHRDDIPGRLKIGGCRVFLDTWKHPLDMEEAEAKVRGLPSLPGPVKPPDDARPAAPWPPPAPGPVGMPDMEGGPFCPPEQPLAVPEAEDGPGASEDPPDAPAPPLEAPGPVERQNAPGPPLAPAPPAYCPFGCTWVRVGGPFG